MADQDRKITPTDSGVFKNFSNRLRLIMRLMKDPRVNPLAKMLPIGAMVYLFVPDLAPGPLDDAIILWLGSTVFIELCPPAVVEEHEENIRQVISAEWKDVDPDDVIDVQPKDLDD